MDGIETKRLDQIGEVVSGATPSTTKLDYWDGEIVWITPNDLSKLGTPYLHSSGKLITEKGLDSCSARLLPPGSITISSRAPIGYVAIPTVEFCTNQGCKSIELRPEFDSEYTYYNICFHVDALKNVGEGTTFSEISKTALAKVEMPFITDRLQQTKIASILSTIDQAIEQTEAIIAKQQRIKTGLMQDLLTRGIDEHGNLRSEETHEFKDSALGRIPVEWEVEPLGQNLLDIGQGWSPDCESEPAAIDEWGVLKTTAVVWEGYNGSENKRLPAYLKSRPGLEVKQGDILMTRAGPNSRVGVISYVYETQRKKLLSDKLYRLIPLDTLEGRFLVYSLSSFASQRHLSTLKTGMAESQTNISQEIVRKMLTVIPPIDEQLRIADFLDTDTRQRYQAFALEKKLHRQKTALMQDLLTGKVRVTPLLEAEAR